MALGRYRWRALVNTTSIRGSVTFQLTLSYGVSCSGGGLPSSQGLCSMGLQLLRFKSLVDLITVCIILYLYYIYSLFFNFA
jgi:hypothetical protein